MRAPFTGIVFALELTHDINALLPLVIGVFVAHGFTVLTLRRSILTEKISRRGYHLSREYAIDPLEIQFVREVMRTNIVALSTDTDIGDLPASLHADGHRPVQHLYPVVDEQGDLTGVVTRHDLQVLLRQRDESDGRHRPLSELARHDPVVAYMDEPLRAVVYRMAQTGLTRFPVVERNDPRRIAGLISLNDLLRARERNLEEERQRERILRLHLFSPRRARFPTGAPDAPATPEASVTSDAPKDMADTGVR